MGECTGGFTAPIDLSVTIASSPSLKSKDVSPAMESCSILPQL